MHYQCFSRYVLLYSSQVEGEKEGGLLVRGEQPTLFLFTTGNESPEKRSLRPEKSVITFIKVCHQVAVFSSIVRYTLRVRNKQAKKPHNQANSIYKKLLCSSMYSRR